MLVLTRKINEAVELTDSRTGESLGTVTLMGIAGGVARLGFDFPRHVQILRDDVPDRNNPQTRKQDDGTTDTERDTDQTFNR